MPSCEAVANLSRYGAALFFGAIWALGIGHLVVAGFHAWMRAEMKIKDDNVSVGKLPRALTGVIERFIFMLAAAAAPAFGWAGALPWLALKMAANWNRDLDNDSNERISRARMALLALVAGLMSMFFAVSGGAIIRWYLGLNPFPNALSGV